MPHLFHLRSFTILIATLCAVGFSACEDEDVLSPEEIITECHQGVSPVRKVLFIGIDGCRTDALIAAASPAIDSLMAHGYVNLHCDRGPYTVSAPGWSTLLHGVYPDKHGVTSNDFTGREYGIYFDLFKYLRAANSEYSLATVSHWDNFLRITSNENYAQPVGSDVEVKTQALYLLQSCTPDVLLLHFDDIDHTGHDSGFSPDHAAYIASIQVTGVHIAAIMEAIELREQNMGEEWMVIVVTDHGGVGTGHGDQDNEDVTRFVFSIVRLPGIARIDLPVASNVDIMPTVLDYMNVPIDANWDLDGVSLF